MYIYIYIFIESRISTSWDPVESASMGPRRMPWDAHEPGSMACHVIWIMRWRLRKQITLLNMIHASIQHQYYQ